MSWTKKTSICLPFWCHHVWTMCEHYCVNIHLWIASLHAIVPCIVHAQSTSFHLPIVHLHLLHCNILPLAYHHMLPSLNIVWTLMCEHPSVLALYMSMHNVQISPCVTICEQCLNLLCVTMCEQLCEHYCMWTSICELLLYMLLYPACPCTKQVYVHLHLLHCHLHITMCHHVWTMCEHYCVNIHLPIVSLNAIVPCMSMHKASLSTSTSTTLPLAYHHVSPSVNNVWTLLCEHASTNCFFKGILPCMFMHNASLCTSTSTTLPLAYHNASLSTSTSTTLPLAYHHVSPCMWTLLCEHASTNCFLKLIATCMSRHNVNVCTCTCNILLLASEHVQHVWMCAHPCSTLWILYDHVTTCVKVWTMLSSVFVKMYYMVP